MVEERERRGFQVKKEHAMRLCGRKEQGALRKWSRALCAARSRGNGHLAGRSGQAADSSRSRLLFVFKFSPMLSF